MTYALLVLIDSELTALLNFQLVQIYPDQNIDYN